MNILIVNAFGNSASGQNKFNAFLTLIKSSFKKVSENSGIEKFNYIIRTPLTIGDFTYSNFLNPFEETSDSKNRKNFNSLDMIFIDGSELYLPWKPKSKKLFEFIKLCKENNKALFAGGVALQILIYYLTTNSMAEYTIINSKGEIKALEELENFPSNYFKGTKTNEIFLDFVTGDLLGYRENENSWEPMMNIGLHHQITAEKYFDRGKFVLNDAVKYQNKIMNEFKKKSNSLYFNKDIIQSEIKIIPNKQNMSHYLLKKCSSEFNAFCTLEWFPHFINVTSKKFQFKIICQSNRGPSVIEHENSVGVIFHPNPKYWDSSYILKNFIHNKFNEVKDKLLGVKTLHKLDSNEEKDNSNSLFKRIFESNNDNIMSGKYGNEKDIDLNEYKYSLMKKVTNSCLFTEMKLVKHEAKHVGQGISNREMIFVENNYINQRIFQRCKNNMDKLKVLQRNNNINNNDINKNKEDQLYKAPRINNKKIKIASGFLLKKNSKGILTTFKRIKKPKEILNTKNLNSVSNLNKNKTLSKSQKLKIKKLNLKTENSKNYFNVTTTQRMKKLRLNRENEDLEDFNNYPSIYPRLPSLDELQKFKNNNFLGTAETNFKD